jgi:hypothetical protein
MLFDPEVSLSIKGGGGNVAGRQAWGREIRRDNERK